MQQINRSIEPAEMNDEHKLLFMMGEELKKPLSTIKILAEQSDNVGIQLEARRALRSVDNLLYLQQISSNQTNLAFTTVHVGDTLTQVAYDMKPLSLEKGCETYIEIQSGMSPVHADPSALRFGIESLWQAVLGMTNEASALNWQIYRTKNGVRITVFNDSLDLSEVKLYSKYLMRNKTRQPFKGVAGPATDLVTAQGIFALIGSKLSKVKKDGRLGLAVTLTKSSQLALV